MVEEIEEPEEVPTGRISIAGDLILIRIVALIYGVISLLIIVLGLTSFNFDLGVIIGIVILAVGFVVGIIGVMLGTIHVSDNPSAPSLNTILVIITVVMYVTGIILIVYGNQNFMNMGDMTPLNIAVLALATIFTLAYFETMHAVLRFTQIAEYAANHNLTDFSVKPVITNYLVWSIILYVFIWVATAFVVAFDFLLKLIISPFSPQFIDSIIMNSAYSLAITMFIVFLPIVTILTFIFAKGKKTVKTAQKEREGEFEVAAEE